MLLSAMKIAGISTFTRTHASRRPELTENPGAPAQDVYVPGFRCHSPSGLGSWLGGALAVAMAATLALSGPAALAANLPSRIEMQTASGQMHPPVAPGGSAHDLTPNQVREATANSLTQVPAGQPAYQAADSNQMSKHYYRPEIEAAIAQARQNGSLTPARLAQLMSQHESREGGSPVRQGNLFRYCIGQNPSTLACNAVVPNQLSYKILSCEYKDAQGQLATVLHRSMDHLYTPAMQRSVCGGHRLEVQQPNGFPEWRPVQTSPDGSPLYLNPAHIIAVLPR